MSVASVKAQLALLQPQTLDIQGHVTSGIPGVLHAFAQPPGSLNTAEMPCFINLTGPATNNWQDVGDEAVLEARIYTMRLYVLPVSNGLPGEGERLCEPFFTSVRNYFAARPQLGNLAGVQAAYVIGDSGVIPLVFDNLDQKILGIEFKLQVQEYIGFKYVE